MTVRVQERFAVVSAAARRALLGAASLLCAWAAVRGRPGSFGPAGCDRAGGGQDPGGERAAGWIEGTVRSVAGTPVAGAEVRARPRRAWEAVPRRDGQGVDGEGAATTTDERGVYRLPRGTTGAVLEISHPGFASGSIRVADAPARAGQADVVLVPAASIHGRVIDLPTALGVPRATVVATGELDVGSMVGARDRATAATGPDGSFVLRGLRPGIIRLVASSADRTSRAPTIVPLTLGDELAGVEVWVDLAYRISGRVVHPSDGRAPETGVLVRARDPWTGEFVEARAPTGGDGRFELRGLRPGSYAVEVRRPGGAPRDTEIRVAVEGADVRDLAVPVDPTALGERAASPLPAPSGENARSCAGRSRGLISGRVVDARGRPWPGAWVVARMDPASSDPVARADAEAAVAEPAPPADAQGFSDARGVFALSDLCDGRYLVSAYALATLGRANLSGVRPGDRLSFTLGGPSSLFVRVREHDEAVPRFDVLLRGPVTRRARVDDAEGELRLRWLEPGAYELTVATEDAGATRSISLEPDAVESLDVSLSPPEAPPIEGDSGDDAAPVGDGAAR